MAKTLQGPERKDKQRKQDSICNYEQPAIMPTLKTNSKKVMIKASFAASNYNEFRGCLKDHGS